ncbi:MAG: tape measure protein [Humidesulfovibrio sp.]
MAAETQIIISARDLASATMLGVGKNAQSLGQQVNMVGRNAQEALKPVRELFQERIGNNLNETALSASLNNIGKAAGMSRLELGRLHMQHGDTVTGLKMIGAAAMPVAAGVMAVGAAMIYAGKASFDAAVENTRLAKSYLAIEGGAAAATAQLKYIYDESVRLGMQFQQTASSAKTFFASGKGTPLEGEMNKIFSAVSEAGAALNMSQDDINGVFRALGQMMSKGKVQAEELRGQLGERLPGAFTLAAKAMGITTAELDKMLEQGQVLADDLLPKLADVLHNKYGKAAEEAAKASDAGAQAVNSMSTEWELFKAGFMDTDWVVSAIRRVTSALREQNEMMVLDRMQKAGIKPDLTSGMGALGTNPRYLKNYGYTDQQIQAFKEYGTDDMEAINRMVRAQQEKSRQDYEDISLEKTLGKAGSLSKGFLSGTKESQRQKIVDDSSAALKALEEARDKDAAHAERWSEKIQAVHAETARKLAALNKQEDTKARKEQSDYSKAVDAATAHIRELSASEEELSAVKIENKYANIRKELGAANPLYRELISLEQQHADLASARKVADEREGALKKDLQARVEFDKAYRASTMSESAFKAAQIEAQAEAWKSAGADEVKVAQWVEREKTKASREWQDGAKLSFDAYVDNATNAAKVAGDAMTSGLKGMEDGLYDFFMTGEISWENFGKMIQSTMARASAQSIVGAGAGLLKSSDLFSGFSLSGLLGGRASGGGVSSGRWLVGEDGPEILEMNGNGYVYNAAQTQAMLSGASGSSSVNVAINNSYDFRGADSGTEARLRRYVDEMSRQTVKDATAAVEAKARRGGSYAKSLAGRPQ